MIRKKDFNFKAGLDRAGRRIVKGSGLSPSEAEAFASSPFLYARLQANIKGELEQQDAARLGANLVRASRRAIPAMGLAAALSFGLLYVNGSKSSAQPFSVDAYLGAGESGMDNMLFAERRPLTADEVLITIVSRDEREASR